MQRRTRRTLIGLIAALAAVGVAVLLAPASIGRAPSPHPSATGDCFDLAAEVDPKEVPVDTGYDPEADLVYAHANGRTYAMHPGDAACRALTAARGVIDDTMQAHAENMQVACRVMSDIVAEHRTEVRGRRVDPAAAQRFLSQRCETSR